jgi:hypothetical protein
MRAREAAVSEVSAAENSAEMASSTMMIGARPRMAVRIMDPSYARTARRGKESGFSP